jgi:hypothetical protein
MDDDPGEKRNLAGLGAANLGAVDGIGNRDAEGREWPDEAA